MKPSGNKTTNHEPSSHPTIRKPKSPGGPPLVTRDNPKGTGKSVGMNRVTGGMSRMTRDIEEMGE